MFSKSTFLQFYPDNIFEAPNLYVDLLCGEVGKCQRTGAIYLGKDKKFPVLLGEFRLPSHKNFSNLHIKSLCGGEAILAV